ncbi:DUF4169 family protein [Abyssibius alkaniclasticus]|uniref:DUF4169 family protein n=1 Tax=Abyssibius alkaniclasticus TaxID=2881234 RepID=UPI002363AB9D|nr:DUF4169 family protein [Abyssibius alkaniclasticus]UPH72164.1 DUF4169 family protein [Abyssibius alkaniclasticus]
MNGKPINLKRARKSAARAEAARKGDENAARHGQTKPARDLHAARAAKAARDHDGHKRDG